MNSKGLTLIESVLAIGIVAIVSLSAASYFYSHVKTVNQMGDSNRCSVVLGRTMANLKARGMMNDALVYRNAGTGPALPTNVAGRGIPNDLRTNFVSSAGDLIQYDAGNPVPVTLRLPVLMNGSMGAIASLYNSDINGFCGSAQGREIPAPSEGATPIISDAQSAGLLNFRATMRIRPYSLANGQPLGNCPQFIPRPASRNEPPPGVDVFPGSGPAMFRIPADYRADLGYLVTLFASYRDRADGPVKECRVEERFQYPVDTAVSAAPVPYTTPTVDYPDRDPNATFVNLPNPIPSRLQCQHQDGVTRGQATIEIGFRAPPGSTRPALEPGSVMLCRDVSRPLLGSGWCTQGNGGRGRVGPDSLPPTSHNPATTRWVPCDRVTACGIAPESVEFNFGNSYGTDAYYRFRFNSERIWGCDIRMEYAAIDPAGNVRMATSSNLQAYFPPPPCYSCVRRRRRGFFNVQLCFIAIRVGIGQSGGCRGQTFHSCEDVQANRVSCRLMRNPPRPIASSDVFCPARSGTFQDVPGATWSIPETPDGEATQGIYLGPNPGNDTVTKTVRCETQFVCNNGNWENLDEPGFPLCQNLYTRMEYTDSITGASRPVCTTAYDVGAYVNTFPPGIDSDTGQYPVGASWYQLGIAPAPAPPATPLPSCEPPTFDYQFSGGDGGGGG